MISLPFKVTLTSDAEPGSGLAAAAVQQCVTRDAAGLPVLRASHLKGLMRQRLAQITASVADLAEAGADLEAACFGRGGEEGDEGVQSRVALTDAPACAEETVEITRTALGELGTVLESSLRISEAVPVATVFSGVLRIDADAGDPVDLASRLALLAIEAVGAHRTRGAGACVAAVDGETRGPGDLLRELAAALEAGQLAEPLPAPSFVEVAGSAGELGDGGSEPVWLRLDFDAKSPICCPESPIIGLNVIRSGTAIPASAVQGALLTKLSSVDREMGSACFAHPAFRAWPLLPMPAGVEARSLPTRVALSHRMSKLADDDGCHTFRDPAIEPYDWRQVAAGSPLKRTDGVMFVDAADAIRLWPAREVPIAVTAHGVHRDAEGGRNLFTVEAIAATRWAGLVSVPEAAADALIELLVRDPDVSFGKARSVRGGGHLKARRVVEDPFAPSGASAAWHGRVYVVQSPLALPDDWTIGRAEKAMERLLVEAGWGRAQRADGSGEPEIWASAGLRFGWNRHGLGARAVSKHRRLRARRCILPGSVVVLEKALTAPDEQLRRGVGAGRDAGFGALAPHPGLAEKLYRREPSLARRACRDAAGKLGLELWRRQEQRSGPTPSQIGALIRRVQTEDKETLLAYLEKQTTERPERAWRRWKHLASAVETLVQEQPPEVVRSALRSWQDLAVSHRGEER